MIHTMQSMDVRRALLLAAGLATLWAALAIAREGVTYHLAPLIVAAVPGIAGCSGQTIQRNVATRLAAVGLAGSLGVSLLLRILGRLEGPSLLPFGDATAEAVVFSGVGAVAGWLVGRQSVTRRPQS